MPIVLFALLLVGCPGSSTVALPAPGVLDASSDSSTADGDVHVTTTDSAADSFGDAGDTDGGSADAGACNCLSGTRCVAGECQPSTQLYVSIGESFSDSKSQRVQVSSRVVVRQEPLDTNEVLAANDECTVQRVGAVYEPTHEVGCWDWGEVSLAGAGLIGGGRTLDYQCIEGEATALEAGAALFAAGQPVTVTGSGGTGFPSFSESLALQTPVNGAMDEPVSGDPVVATWTPNGAEHVAVFVAAGSITISCSVEDTGSLTVPASLTKYLPADTPSSGVIIRSQRIHLEPLGTSVVIDIYSYADQSFSF